MSVLNVRIYALLVRSFWYINDYCKNRYVSTSHLPKMWKVVGSVKASVFFAKYRYLTIIDPHRTSLI